MKHSEKLVALFGVLICSSGLIGCSSSKAEDTSSADSSSLSTSESVVETEHSWDNGTVIKEATCGSPAITRYTCTTCHQTKDLPTGKATGQHQLTDHVCSVCGYVDMSSLTKDEALSQYGYYHEDKDSSKTISAADRLFYGSYPQSEVKEANTVSSLNALIAEDKWVSYGYLVENQVSDFMKYQDVTLENEKYRAVSFTSFRPYQTDVDSTNSFQSQNGYQTNATYWFKYESLEWRVLDYADGKATMQTLHAVDAQSYGGVYTKDGGSYRNADGTYINNWASSNIRSFLNGSFYSSSFTSKEQSAIVSTTLDNATTSYSTNNEFATVQSETEDKVFLLSYQDMINERHLFPNVESTSMSGEANGDASVCKSGTAYALCQGLRISNQTQNEDGEPCSWWMLRSAGGKNYSICGISKYGTITKSNAVTYTAGQAKEQDGTCFYTAEGIAPAIQLTLGK